MTDFQFDKFRTIVADGNLSLVSDSALTNASSEIEKRAASQPGDFPAEERNPEVLKVLRTAVNAEIKERPDLASE